MNAADQDTLLEFPCDFPIKVMGARHNDFAQTVVDIVLKHAPDYRAETVEMRLSGAGNYISLTCTIQAVSRAQLDAVYRELSAHPLVKVVL